MKTKSHRDIHFIVSEKPGEPGIRPCPAPIVTGAQLDQWSVSKNNWKQFDKQETNRAWSETVNVHKKRD